MSFDFRTRAPRRRYRHPVPAETSKRIGKRGHVRLGVDVPPDVKAALIEIAEGLGVTVSDVHREALLDYIGRQRPSREMIDHLYSAEGNA